METETLSVWNECSGKSSPWFSQWKATFSVFYVFQLFNRSFYHPGGRTEKKKKKQAKWVKSYYFYAFSHTSNRVTHCRADVHLIYAPCKLRELISICSVEEEVKTLRLDTTMSCVSLWCVSVLICDLLHRFVSVYLCATACTVLIQQQEKLQGGKDS